MTQKAIFNEYGTAYRIVYPGFHSILIPASFVLDAANTAARILFGDGPHNRGISISGSVLSGGDDSGIGLLSLDMVALELAERSPTKALPMPSQEASIVKISGGRVFINDTLFAHEILDDEAARILGVDMADSAGGS